MTKPDSGDAELLQRRAGTLRERYARTPGWRFVAVFFPIPFVLVLLRLEVEAWHYYVAGGLYVVFAAGLYAYDSRMSARCDAAEAVAARARGEAR